MCLLADARVYEREGRGTNNIFHCTTVIKAMEEQYNACDLRKGQNYGLRFIYTH